MSIDDLKLIANKEHVISTWSARSLIEKSSDVEKDYMVHARTHLSLGDTAKYVDLALKWVGGDNKGTFVGAVLGEYGEGKTSFLIHLWDQSRQRKVFTVPPFEWSIFEDIPTAISGWVQYVLRDSHAELARRAQRLYENFTQRTVEDVARKMAEEQDRQYEDILVTVRDLMNSGTVQMKDLSAAQVLDLIEQLTDVVMEGGYKGLLVLLDEPELAAKSLGSEAVQHFLFQMTNELNQRQGNYGVFLSMPANFFALAQRRFSALPARLEVRKCFPRLGDLYGPEFAADLWSRYVKEFELGEEGQRLISPLTLQAIGQVGSSECKHLSYGPRSVVSAFRRMVNEYHKTKTPYEPGQFVQDILDQEITVRPEYRSAILAALRSQDVGDENREAVKLLAAFPAGLRTEVLHELEIEEILRPLARAGGLVQRSAYSMKLRSLRSETTDAPESLLRDLVEEIDQEYTPGRQAFENALEAFVKDVIPLIFKEREGQQLVNWKALSPLKKAARDVYTGAMQGAFAQMERQFPNRAVLLVVNGLDASLDNVDVPPLNDGSGRKDYEMLFQFQIRWNVDSDIPDQLAKLREDGSRKYPPRITLYLDLTKGLVVQEHLAETVGAARMTPLWTLNLLHRLDTYKDLPRETETEWRALRAMILRQLPSLFFDDGVSQELACAAQQQLGEKLPDSGVALLGSVSNVLLKRRYPTYQTLIRQPHWQGTVDNYINALNSSEIPLSCKRGREAWKAETDKVTRILKTSRMNLTGGAFAGLENLIEIKSKGRGASLEITFHVHPLEDEIREFVKSQPLESARKFKRGRKECWYIPTRDLLPMILDKGYTAEELGKIVQMGQARNSFKVTEYQGEDVVYSEPLDPEELKIQLQGKMSDLVKEIAEYRSLPNYTSSFDPDVMARAIEKVEDDADYDRLMTRMNREFETNHTRLPVYFTALQEQFEQIRKRIKEDVTDLSGSRQARHLEIPSAKSPWVTTLSRCIVTNLKQQYENTQKDAERVSRSIGQSLKRFVFSQQATPAENLQLLKEGWFSFQDVEADGNKLRAEARDLLGRLNDLEKWIDLRSQSDQLYERLLELKGDDAHRSKGEELLAKFDELSERIGEHLEIRNILGLDSHRQFEKDFVDLEKERQSYLTDLKGGFDRGKDQLNGLLDALNTGLRTSVVFNPMDIAASYQQLYDEGASLLHQYLDRAQAEMETQEREFAYARDILRVIDDETSNSFLAALRAGCDTVLQLKGQIDGDWLRDLPASEDEGAIAQIREKIDNAFEVARQARRTLQECTSPTPPDNERARAMYDLIPDGRVTDLKDLVLQMMAQTGTSTDALDASLEALAELFRRNCIQIRVEKRRSQS